MKIGQFTFLSNEVLQELTRFLLREVKEIIEINAEKLSYNADDESLECIKICSQLTKLESVYEQLQQFILSSDEKEILLTGGLVKLIQGRTPSIFDEKWRKKCETTFIEGKSISEMLVLKLHDYGAAKWESILSFDLFIQDPNNYQSYAVRKEQLAKKIFDQYGTDIYGRDKNCEANKLNNTLTFFPTWIKEPLLDPIFDQMNTLRIDGFKFYSYWDLREAFENTKTCHLIEELSQIVNFYLPSVIPPKKNIEALEEIFNTLDQAAIPEYDKSLIATGGLLELTRQDYYINGDRINFNIYVCNEELVYHTKSRQAAIESYELYKQNPNEYKIYFHRNKENELTNIISKSYGH